MQHGIIIADDDAVMRLGLKMLVDWEQTSFRIIGEAENGREALALCERMRPEILITDMKMPVMDGIALIRALKKNANAPKIIVLSSYDEFELVREAMRLGSADYLLKMDLNAEVLLQTLHSLSDAAEGSPVRLTALRAQLVKNIISRFFLSDADLRAQLAAAEAGFFAQPVCCFAIEACAAPEAGQNEEEYRTICLSLINITEEIARDSLQGFCAEGYTGEFYLLGAPLNPDADTVCGMYQLAGRLRQMLEQYLDLQATIGFSCGNCTVDGLYTACKEARLAGRAALRKGLSCLQYDAKLSSAMPEPSSLSAEVRRMQQYIAQHFAEDVSLPALAQRLELSPGHLSAMMKKQLGLPFSEYVLYVRLAHAQELLSSTNLKIYEVAEKTGYHDPFYFSKLFKRAFGVSPGDYRRGAAPGRDR